MLRASRKGETDGAVDLAPEEDCLLRDAFGRRFGAGADRGSAGGRPLSAARRRSLVPLRLPTWRGAPPCLGACVANAHTPPSGRAVAVYSEDCVFFRDSAEQRIILDSHMRAAAARPTRLARSFDVAASALNGRIEAHSHTTKRPGLARLLLSLAEAAGFQIISAGWRPAPLVDQVKALWQAARAIELDADVPMPNFLCTNAARLEELAEKVAAAQPHRFTRNRPHGVLIARIAAIGTGTLQPAAGDPIAVRGRIAVFGERPDDARDTPAERAARAPYLAACVVGRAAEGGPVEALSAYAHPIAGEGHLMLVDSDFERRTLAQVRSLQTWLAAKKGIRLTIEKPLFDITPSEDGDPDGVARPPCIPDFVVRAEGVTQVGCPRVIVETMGFADEGYRRTKVRTHAAMSAALGGAPVVQHDFHAPSDRSQNWRDTRFWRELRLAITGAEIAGQEVARPSALARSSPTRDVPAGIPPAT